MIKRYEPKSIISTIFSLILVLLLPIHICLASEPSLPCDFYGYETSQVPLNIGDVITVKDPDGIVCGTSTVTVEGEYGFLTCKADDLNTAAIDEGAVEGDTITFFLNGEEVKNKGIWKEGGTVQVDIDDLTDYETISIDLHISYNPVCFAVKPSNLPTPYKASQLIKDLAKQGINVNIVMQWDGEWIAHQVDLFFTDFDVKLDEGLFIRTVTDTYHAGTWNLRGRKISLPKTVNFPAGWHYINVPSTISVTTAQELLQQMNSAGGDVDQVMWWDGDDWIVHMRGLFFTNYELVRGRGYFIHCKKVSSWQMQ